MNTQASTNSFWKDTVIYASRVSTFDKTDWLVYVGWVGMMLGLFGSVTAFLVGGALNGVTYPAYVWNIPIGIFIFAAAISFDTIGHRTVYKEYLNEKGEALVHHMTIFAGVTSIFLLTLAYHYPVFLRIPALILILLSVFYSIVDEGLHWYRYMSKRSDRVEMWSHFFIFLGHNIMVLAWWTWYDQGYQGVKETAQALNISFF